MDSDECIKCFKKIRQQYIPCIRDNPCIKTLIIGESPPEPDKDIKDCESLPFFYNKKNNLFQYTKEAFSDAYPKQWETNEEFLAFFKQKGYYLIDLCDEPVNNKSGHDRRVCLKNGEIPLEESIRRYRPKNIVVAMKGIKKNVDSVLAKFPSNDYTYEKNVISLPFPLYDGIKKYKYGLTGFLKTHNHP